MFEERPYEPPPELVEPPETPKLWRCGGPLCQIPDVTSEDPSIFCYPVPA